MILVREILVAKPGQASKLAAMMKDALGGGGLGNVRVMTDFTGQFNQVVMETEMESMTEFDARMKDYSENVQWREKMKGYTDMYLTGSREVFTLR